MLSPIGERAVNDALQAGRALLKFISPNDTGQTGSHQGGFYLPLKAWKLYSKNGPARGSNFDCPIRITWQDGRVTESCVKWYGSETRHEFRLTRFGKEFPWLLEDNVGSLLVLIPIGHDQFLAYVLDSDEDIQELQAALGVEVMKSWGVFVAGAKVEEEKPAVCVDRRFREFTEKLTEFPEGRVFSEYSWEALEACFVTFGKLNADDQLLDAMDAEYKLFRMAERLLCGPLVQRQFKSIDDFLKTATSIVNRRKARAGRSLENHVERLLKKACVPFEMRPPIKGEPDVVIPSKAAYDDPEYPTNRLFMVGIKTTCKDRWRQVLHEADRVVTKHVLTLQQGISSNQLALMSAEKVQLIVPQRLQKMYPGGGKTGLLSLDAFLKSVKKSLAQ